MAMIRPGNNLLELISRTMSVKSAANAPREQQVYGNRMSTSYTVKPPSPPTASMPAVVSGSPKDIVPGKGNPAFGYRGEGETAPVGAVGSGKRVKLAELLRASLMKRAASLPTPAAYNEDAYLDKMYHMDGPDDHQTVSGNPMYDDLPEEQRAQQRKANSDEFFRDAYKRRNRVARNTTEQTAAQVDAEGGVGNWGNGWLGKGISGYIKGRNWIRNNGGIVGRFLADRVDPLGGMINAARDAATGVSYLTSAPSGMSFGEWSKTYNKDMDQSAEQLGHDVANNFQLQANAAKHGFGQILRWGASKVDPRTWGNSMDARMKRMEYDTAMDNASDLYHERANRIANNFEDSTLNDMNSTLGMLNYGANAAVGEFAGGELATAGVGAAAKGLGKGIQAATNSGLTKARYIGSGFGSTARNLENARNAMVQANGAGRALSPELMNAKAFRMQYAKDMTKAIADTADPAAAAANKALRQQWMQRAGQSRVGGWFADRPYIFAKGVGDTLAAPFNFAGSVLSTSGQSAVANAVGKPVFTAIRHPIQSFNGARSAIANAVKHPLTTIGKPIKGAWNMAMNPQTWGSYGTYSAAGNAAQGNYGGAIKDIGTLGYYNAVGIPGMVLGGVMGGGDGE